MALKKAEVTSDLVDFDFADVKVPNTAFKPLVREGRFDVGELAIVTYLQAQRLRQAVRAHSGNGFWVAANTTLSSTTHNAAH